MTGRSSVVTRALAASAALSTLTVVVMATLVVAVARESFRRQVELRAGEMVQFLAAQSQYPLLVADRVTLEQLAASALQGEDVLSVTIEDSSGTQPPVEAVRPNIGPGAAEHSIQVARRVVGPRGGMFVGLCVIRVDEQIGIEHEHPVQRRSGPSTSSSRLDTLSSASPDLIDPISCG